LPAFERPAIHRAGAGGRGDLSVRRASRLPAFVSAFERLQAAASRHPIKCRRRGVEYLPGPSVAGLVARYACPLPIPIAAGRYAGVALSARCREPLPGRHPRYIAAAAPGFWQCPGASLKPGTRRATAPRRGQPHADRQTCATSEISRRRFARVRQGIRR